MRAWRWYWKALCVVLLPIALILLAPVLGFTVGIILLLAALGMPPSHVLQTLQLLAMGRRLEECAASAWQHPSVGIVEEGEAG
ncbi:MAG: hypothetical protein ACE149_11210 [Armatimonadota bacterium]